jgi:hypothetical protein
MRLKILTQRAPEHLRSGQVVSCAKLLQLGPEGLRQSDASGNEWIKWSRARHSEFWMCVVLL